jgi:hypothetical protein
LEKSGISLSDETFVEHSSDTSRRGRAWIRALMVAGGLVEGFKLLSSSTQTQFVSF